MLEYIILGFLMGMDMSGYDIKQCFSLSMANFYDASFGSIYPALKRLEESGAITARESVEAGKYKKVYAITETGRKAFQGWIERPITSNRGGHDHLVKLFFFGFLEKEKARQLIRDFISGSRRTLEGLDAIEAKVAGQADAYQLATLDYGREHYKFVIAWCGKLLEKLEND